MGTDAYKDAGVDIEAGYAVVDGIKTHVARTRRPEVIGGLGGFGHWGGFGHMGRFLSLGNF